MNHAGFAAGIFLVALVMALAVLFSPGLGKPVTRDTIIRDGAVIAPGFGSDEIMLGEDINAVINRFGTSRFRISRPDHACDLFAHVFKVAGPVTILFDAIYTNEERKCAACVLKGKVVAVIGFASGRSTSDDVNVQRGAENFVFNYGNCGLRVLTSGTNRIYCYPRIGMAIVDDDMNDTIDLYFIFTPAVKIAR